MQKINYGKVLERTLAELKAQGRKPKLLLHACCAPCSSYVLEYISELFEITVLYYNPNISPKEEYDTRANELLRLTGAIETRFPERNAIKTVIAPYDPEPFEAIAKGREQLAEGGVRCTYCYRLRLDYTARYAAEHGFELFCTTLSISPHKNATLLNEIGAELAEQYGVGYLFSDFKKNGGYLRSCELSKEYGLYRQDYCGCIYSKNNKIN